MTTALAPLFDPELRVDLIDENPDNPRKNLGDLSELADSIREQGILEPLVVEPVDEHASRFVLLAGHRRLAAAVQAGLTTVPAIVHPEPSARHVRVERMLTENLQRADLTVVEEGDAYQLLLDMPDAALTPKTLARRLGKSVKHVTATVKAAGLPESTRERILRGQVSLEDAARIDEFAKDKDVLARLNKAAEAGPVALDRALTEAKSAADAAKERARIKRQLRKDGRTVVDPSSDEWHEATFATGIYDDADLELPEDFESQDYAGQRAARSDAIEARHFAEHPDAHLVTIDDGFYGITVNTKCADPDWHATASESPEARAAREAREAADAERARVDSERRMKLEAAATARRHFLGQVAASEAGEKLAKEIARGALEPVLHPQLRPDELAAFAQVVLPNLPAATLDDPKALRARVSAALDRLSLTELVILNDVRLNLARDCELTRTTPYTWSDSNDFGSKPWRDRLTEFYGYEPSPIEVEMHAVYNQGAQ